MAQYKVIQDIEAEDKLVGPLSLRQFIYAGIAAVSAFLGFRLGLVNVFLAMPFVPVVVLFGVLAAPFGREQSSEVWLLAKIRFALKPRKRIWNQDGASHLVSVTAPKTVVRQLTKNLSQTEVSSRLRALANTIDSRGWAVKNVNVNLSAQPVAVQDDTDRLINPSSMPQEVPNYDVSAADDIFSAQNNPTAQKLDQMITKTEEEHKQKVRASVETPQQNGPKIKPDYWFLNEPAQPIVTKPGESRFEHRDLVAPGSDQTPTPVTTDRDNALLEKIKEEKKRPNPAYGHTHVLKPLSEQDKKPNTPVTQETDPAILRLALANNDNWSVATVAHEAQQSKKKEPPQDEVVVSLH